MTATELILAPTDDGDIFECHANGYTTLAWDAPSTRVYEVLRRPVLDELTEVIELTSLADEAVLAADQSDRGRLVTGKDSPYAAAFVRALELLTPHTFKIGDLPPWAARSETMRELIEHWRSRPLPRGMALPSPVAAPESTGSAPKRQPAPRGAAGQRAPA